MSRITVTIDDGGMHEAVNAAAVRCIEAGVVHRFSVIPTGPEAAGACSIAMGGGVQLSAHLDCCRGPFLLPGSRFPHTVAGWMASGAGLAPLVRAEWSAQVEKLLAMGAMVTGLDSHRHLHHLPRLRDIFLDIACDYGIGTIRAAVLPDRMSRFPEGVLLNSMGRRLSGIAGARGLSVASWMLGFGSSGAVDRAYLEKFLARTGESDIELVMHPATERIWSAGQPRELDLMLSEWFARCVG